MTPIANLLTFIGLGITLLLVWRQSWPARLKLFVAQSIVRRDIRSSRRTSKGVPHPPQFTSMALMPLLSRRDIRQLQS